MQLLGWSLPMGSTYQTQRYADAIFVRGGKSTVGQVGRRARVRARRLAAAPRPDDLDLILNLTHADFGELQPLADHPDHQPHRPSAEALPCATRLLSHRPCPPRSIFAHHKVHSC